MNYMLAFDAVASGAKTSLTDIAGNVLTYDKEPLGIYYPRPF
jgi:hypothetical protein